MHPCFPLFLEVKGDLTRWIGWKWGLSNIALTECHTYNYCLQGREGAFLKCLNGAGTIPVLRDTKYHNTGIITALLSVWCATLWKGRFSELIQWVTVLLRVRRAAQCGVCVNGWGWTDWHTSSTDCEGRRNTTVEVGPGANQLVRACDNIEWTVQ